MNYSSFKLANDLLNIDSVAKYLGLDIKNHMCRCVFHNEKMPSMRLYSDHYYCFGCGCSGDTIKLAAEVLHIKPLEAAIILNDEFKLGLDFKEMSIHKETRPPNILISKRRDYEEWYRQAVLILSAYIQCCFDIMAFSDQNSWQFKRAKFEAEQVELIQDFTFEAGPKKTFLHYREEVNKIDRKLQRSIKLLDGVGKQNIESCVLGGTDSFWL